VGSTPSSGTSLRSSSTSFGSVNQRVVISRRLSRRSLAVAHSPGEGGRRNLSLCAQARGLRRAARLGLRALDHVGTSQGRGTRRGDPRFRRQVATEPVFPRVRPGGAPIPLRSHSAVDSAHNPLRNCEMAASTIGRAPASASSCDYFDAKVTVTLIRVSTGTPPRRVGANSHPDSALSVALTNSGSAGAVSRSSLR
jgi:hypothetical protein